MTQNQQQKRKFMQPQNNYCCILAAFQLQFSCNLSCKFFLEAASMKFTKRLDSDIGDLRQRSTGYKMMKTGELVDLLSQNVEQDRSLNYQTNNTSWTRQNIHKRSLKYNLTAPYVTLVILSKSSSIQISFTLKFVVSSAIWQT